MDFDKVDFLDDRREHDKHTSERFKAYAEYEAVTVDDTSSTYELRREMLSKESGIIVTTTFKLNNFVKELIDGKDNRLKEKRIVFIIDEARSEERRVGKECRCQCWKYQEKKKKKRIKYR